MPNYFIMKVCKIMRLGPNLGIKSSGELINMQEDCIGDKFEDVPQAHLYV